MTTDMISTPTRILVCRTCPRYDANPRREKTAGAILAEEMATLLDAAGHDWQLLVVSCLAGCRNPCNAALDGPLKFRLRFSHLQPGDGDKIIAAARVYQRFPDGDLDPSDIPSQLRDQLTAKSPPRIG